MNILDITNEDIARLQENKVVFGLLLERDREILETVGTGNTERYCSSGFLRCIAGGVFSNSGVYRIVSTYSGVWYTEADIIAYLQKSEVPPAQWHPAAQEWARRHEGERIWEFQTKCGITNFWIKTSYLSDSFGIDTEHVHRLRADYGKKDAGYVEFTDPTITNPADIPYGPFTLEPEVCVWEGSRVGTVFKDPHGRSFYFHIIDIKDGRFCPVCGKRIEVKA